MSYGLSGRAVGLCAINMRAVMGISLRKELKAFQTYGVGFVEKVIGRLESSRTGVLCRIGESMLVHRRRGKIKYLECFRELPLLPLNACCGAAFVDSAASVWNSLQLCVECR